MQNKFITLSHSSPPRSILAHTNIPQQTRSTMFKWHNFLQTFFSGYKFHVSLQACKKRRLCKYYMRGTIITGVIMVPLYYQYHYTGVRSNWRPWLVWIFVCGLNRDIYSRRNVFFFFLLSPAWTTGRKGGGVTRYWTSRECLKWLQDNANLNLG